MEEAQQLLINQQELIEQQILLAIQEIKNKKESHCVLMLEKYRDAMRNAESGDERQLFHNIRASVFLELKEVRKVI